METLFVTKRSEITAAINQSPEYYRTRVNCNCRYPFNFRHGALIVSNNVVTHKVIKCKYCAKNKP